MIWDEPSLVALRARGAVGVFGTATIRRRTPVYDVMATCPTWKTHFELGYLISAAEFERRAADGWATTKKWCPKCGAEHDPAKLKIWRREHRERRKRQEIRLESRRGRDALAEHRMLVGWLPRHLRSDEEHDRARKPILLREYLERSEPTRARAVLAYLAFGEEHWPGNNYASEPGRGSEPASKDLKRHGGSPKEIARRIEQRKAKAIPDPREREANRIVQHVRDIVRESQRPPEREITPDQSEIRLGAPTSIEAGLLSAAAEGYAPQLQYENGLLGEDHRPEVTGYLAGMMGALPRAFPHPPTFCPACLEVFGGGTMCPRCDGRLWQRLPGFDEWRQCSERALALPAGRAR